MEKTSVIFSRRSIRKYDSSRRVSREQIEDVLGAAMHAPSAMNKQPWEFVVVNEPKGIAEIMRIMASMRAVTVLTIQGLLQEILRR